MTNNDNGAWVEVLNASTTRAELDQIIETQITIALADVRAQLATMDLGPRDRVAALALVEPVIRAKTAQALTAGWQRLQLDAARETLH